MSFANALYLAGVVCAFFAFMALVAWGQYFTRHVNRAAAPKSPSALATLQRAAAAADARQQQESQPLSATF